MDAGGIEGGTDEWSDWAEGAHDPRTSALFPHYALCFKLKIFKIIYLCFWEVFERISMGYSFQNLLLFTFGKTVDDFTLWLLHLDF